MTKRKMCVVMKTTSQCKKVRLYLNSSICGIFHGLQQFVVLWVEGDSKGTVNDSTWNAIIIKHV